VTPEGRTPQRRGVGRPSVVAQYAPQVAQWLREDPALSSVRDPAARPACQLSRRQERALRTCEAAEGAASGKPGQTLCAEVTVAAKGSLGPVEVPEVTRR